MKKPDYKYQDGPFRLAIVESIGGYSVRVCDKEIAWSVSIAQAASFGSIALNAWNALKESAR